MFFRPEEYKKKVMDYVKKYASEEALRQSEQDAVSSSSESSMSDFSEDEAQVRDFANHCKLNDCGAIQIMRDILRGKDRPESQFNF